MLYLCRDYKPDKALAGSLVQCNNCPYRGKIKDLNAHRKLHKQRPGATYKCPECPYWVNHNRLLQQHVKVGSLPSLHASRCCVGIIGVIY